MTKQDLQGDLEGLGVRAGDLLMLHASLRGIGLARAEKQGGSQRDMARAYTKKPRQ